MKMRPIRKLLLVIFHFLPDAFLVQKGNKDWTWSIANLNCSITLRPDGQWRPWTPSWDGVGLWLLWWCSDSGQWRFRRLREKSDTPGCQNISQYVVVLDIIWETDWSTKQFVMSSNFVFVQITVGFIIVVALLLLENRRDNIKLRQLNAKIKDLIAGDYSEVVDMQGNSELTDMIIVSMICLRLFALTRWKLGTRKPSVWPVSFLTWQMRCFTTNRRWSDHRGSMKWPPSRGEYPIQMRCSIPVFWLLSIGDDWYAKLDYITRVDHRFPRMKMGNT